MKYLLAITIGLSVSSAFAQIHEKSVSVREKSVSLKVSQTPGVYAVIRGHIKNNNGELLDYGTDDYLDFAMASIPIDKQGNFTKKIRINGTVREIDLMAGMGILLKLAAKDTLDIEWDNNNVNGTVTFKTSNPAKAAEFQKAFKQRAVNITNHQTINGLFGTTKTDSAKFEVVNDCFNKEIETLIVDDQYNLASKMAVDAYFDYSRMMLMLDLVPHYELYLKSATAKKMIPWMTTDRYNKPYKTESEENFKNSSRYRDFIFDYLRIAPPFTSNTVIKDGISRSKKGVGLTPAYSDYYSGLGSLHLTEIRDWYVTKSIFTDFQFYDFNDASGVYHDFLGKVKIPFYADTLKAFYGNMLRLKPGVPAPIFKLKDETGKYVSLSDFKGKTVYMDFWGVGCGPCIMAIKDHVPALHAKYKDKKVVFINVCVDSDENTWKESLKKLNLNGVNLIAEGWTRNPVCNTYNVTVIPHYFLIDKTGQIVDNNSKGPGYGIDEDIDKLLK